MHILCSELEYEEEFKLVMLTKTNIKNIQKSCQVQSIDK